MRMQSLAMLIELATSARDAALSRLAEQQQRVAQAAAQLEVLRNYARDYRHRSQAQQAAGCDPAARRNWHAFAHKLDQAIGAQEDEVRSRERQLAVGAQQVQQAERKLRSLEALAERRRAALRAQAQRVDQKRTDEQARDARDRLTATEW